MPSNGTRDPDRHQSGSRKLSMQCGVLRAHPLLDLPGQSRMVRQGSLGSRAELDSGDDVLAHGKRKTGANMNGRIWRTRPMSRIRCADGADEMNFRAVELQSMVIQSLTNIQTARKELLAICPRPPRWLPDQVARVLLERDSGNSGETKSAI
jgi:hypothetical protein